jgi:hypothetical protein
VGLNAWPMVDHRGQPRTIATTHREPSPSATSSNHPACSERRPIWCNLLKLLLTSLSRPAVPETEIWRHRDRSPFKTGRFARSPCALSSKTETGHQPARATQPGGIARKTMRRFPPSPSNPSPGVAATILQCGAPIRTDFATAQALRRETARISALRRTWFSWLGAGRPILRSRCFNQRYRAGRQTSGDEMDLRRHRPSPKVPRLGRLNLSGT